MTTDNPITDLLSAPLVSDWTVDQLAEEVLSAIAARGPEEAQEFVLDAEATSDRQSRRLLRPLLACLATKSAAEAGTPPNLYGGGLAFKRLGHEGPVWILGNFENRPGTVRVAFRRTSSPPQNSELTTGQLPVVNSASSRVAAPPPRAGASGPDDSLAATLPTDQASLADKRRRAESWAAAYAHAAPAGALLAASVPGASSPTSPAQAVAMCYEIGKIYRDTWLREDAETLARTLPICESASSFGVGAASGFIPIIPLIGPVIGAILARATTEHRLLSASRLIIEYFEAAH